LSNRKPQNSIIFLTTLGVYLGLLMVGGAAPQVMAHSATTRNFEITDEIEVRDEIDTDPDESIQARISLTTYFQDVENFIYTLKQLDGTKYFNAGADDFDVTQTTQLPCVPANKIGSYTANNFVTKNESIRPWLESFSKLLTDGYSLGDCLPNSRFAPAEATDSKFNFHLDKKELNIEVVVRKNSPEGARLLADAIASVFTKLRTDSDSATRLRLYETTRFRADNDQIFVITRLPRAALDPLLAKDAK
jgi:hypothetical protein